MKSTHYTYLLTALLLQASLNSGNGVAADPSQEKGQKILDEEALTAKEYADRGVPPVEKPWTVDELSAAAKALTAVAQRKSKQLPRYKGARSGGIFSQLTSDHYLKVIKDKSIPIETRFQQVIGLLRRSNQLFLTYANALTAGTKLDEEVIELTGAQLRLTATFITFMDEMIPTLDKNNPQHQVRIKAYANMGNRLADIVNGATITLAEKAHYRPRARVRLIAYEKQTFPVIVPRLPAKALQQVVNRLETLSQDKAYADLQPGLRELLELVRGLEKSKN